MTAARVSKPTSLRDRQREATRAWIRKAARTSFMRDGVRAVSMEAIAAEAGIRRATLYLYYPGKNALLLDLLEQSLRATDRIYLRLRDLPEVTRGSVRQWLADYLREVEQHSSAVDLFRSAILSDEKLREILRGHVSRTIELLADRFKSFELTGPVDAKLMRRRFEAELMVREIEAFCAEARLPDYHLDREAGLDVLADRLFAMVKSG